MSSLNTNSLAVQMLFVPALQIYTVKTGTPVKKCTCYKYLPYTLQCKSVDITVNHRKSVFTFFHCTWSIN
jgi:hypothetical protein